MEQDKPSEFGDEPVRRVSRDGVEYTLLGTAHVSRTSAGAVRHLLASGDFDAVAIELCQSRYRTITDVLAWRQMNLFGVIRKGMAGMLMASLALTAYQRRIADQLGVEPGAEMKAAIEEANRLDIPVQLIDREIGITLRRTARKLSLWRRWLLLNGLVLSIFSRDKFEEDEIEKLKQGDILERTFSEFAEASPALYEGLIGERDEFMAARLRLQNEDHPGRRVLAVIGAGHLAGTERALSQGEDPAGRLAKLNVMPPASNFLKVLPWAILLAVLTGFFLGFRQSPELGWSLVATWVVINGGLSALGALIALAHPLTVLTALVAAPLTSLNPTLGAGMVTAAMESWLRKPMVSDFETLRDDVVSLAGWWHNRVSRILLVFFLSNMGSVAGTWIAGARMVQQLTS